MERPSTFQLGTSSEIFRAGDSEGKARRSPCRGKEEAESRVLNADG
jgi:hypothetical protein